MKDHFMLHIDDCTLYERSVLYIVEEIIVQCMKDYYTLYERSF